MIRKIDAATGAERLRLPFPREAGAQGWLAGFHDPAGRVYGVAEMVTKARRHLELWDVAAGKRLHTFEGGGSPGMPVQLLVSPAGDRGLVPPPLNALSAPPKAGPQPPARLVALPAGDSLTTFALAPALDKEFPYHLRLGPGGTRLLSLSTSLDMGQNRSLMSSLTWVVRGVPSGAIELEVPNRTAAERAGDFCPDGRYVALGSDRGFVELWDLEAKALVFRWQPHGGKTVHAVTFSPAGDIATASEDDDRVCVLKWAAVRDRLKELGLGW